jgi:hypothetical protein
MSHIIHHSQGLALDHLAFDPTNVTKHGLTYIELLKVRSKENLYLLFPLLIFFFQVDHLVQEKLVQLRTNAQYKLVIVSLKSYHSKFIIVQSFNTHSFNITF